MRPFRKLIVDAIAKQQARAATRGHKLSVADIERRAGVAGGTLSRLINAKRRNPPHLDTALKLGKGLEIAESDILEAMRLESLMPPARIEADGSDDKQEPEFRNRPVSAETVRQSDYLIDQAWDEKRHRPADAAAVSAILRAHHALLRTDPSNIAVVRTWLDTAALLRSEGQEVTVESLRRAMEVQWERVRAFLPSSKPASEDKPPSPVVRYRKRSPPLSASPHPSL